MDVLQERFEGMVILRGSDLNWASSCTNEMPIVDVYIVQLRPQEVYGNASFVAPISPFGAI